MASYTMQLREYIESFSYPNLDTMKRADIIEAGRPYLFDFDYPIFDESYRKDFETRFIKHFYMREIGFETEGLFKLALDEWLNENMPYWNKMYQSDLLQYDPLKNSNVDVTHNKTNDKTQNDSSNSDYTGSNDSSRTSNNTTTEDNFDRLLESNTPDGRLTITTSEGEGVIEYASAIEENKANNNTTSNETDSSNSSQNGSLKNSSNSKVDETETYNEHREGKLGSQSYAKMIQEYRDTFLRIDKSVFKEMNELFMLIY